MTINIYRSTVECIQDVIMTGGSNVTGPAPYTFWTAYYLMVPNLQPNDIIDLRGQFEVTNPWNFNVQLDRFIARGTIFGGSELIPVDPVFTNAGDNIPPELHHKRDIVMAIDTGQTGNINYSLCLEAASYAITPTQNYLILEKGYGGIIAIVHRADAPST